MFKSGQHINASCSWKHKHVNSLWAFRHFLRPTKSSGLVSITNQVQLPITKIQNVFYQENIAKFHLQISHVWALFQYGVVIHWQSWWSIIINFRQAIVDMVSSGLSCWVSALNFQAARNPMKKLWCAFGIQKLNNSSNCRTRATGATWDYVPREERWWEKWCCKCLVCKYKLRVSCLNICKTILVD